MTHRGSTVFSFLGRLHVADLSGLPVSTLRSNSAYVMRLFSTVRLRFVVFAAASVPFCFEPIRSTIARA